MKELYATLDDIFSKLTCSSPIQKRTIQHLMLVTWKPYDVGYMFSHVDTAERMGMQVTIQTFCYSCMCNHNWLTESSFVIIIVTV